MPEAVYEVFKEEFQKERAEGRMEGRMEGQAEGQKEGMITTLAGLVQDGLLSEDAAARRANLSVADFRTKAML